MKEKLTVAQENKALREMVEHSFEMVQMLKGYADNPRAFTDQQKKDLQELYLIYLAMLDKVGFSVNELILPN